MQFFRRNRAVAALLLIIAVSTVSGCARMRHAVPADKETKAVVDGMSDIRAFVDGPNQMMKEDVVQSLMDEPKGSFPDGVYPILSISGGGANGAWGAGLLKGWSESGKRPKFKAVTGISTGAIIAPYAFLGSEYDDELEILYTTMTTRDVVRGKGPLAALLGDSLMSNRPLEKLIKKHATDEMLAAIAEEHRKGRRLYVGTTNLDAQRLMIWNMGKIAESGNRDLFAQVILASAAIPIAFPPTFVEVEVDGKKYQEMHVDGGTVTQAFAMFAVLNGLEEVAKNQGLKISGKRSELYVLRNGYVNPNWKQVEDKLAPIASRAMDTLINYQGLGDMYRMYAATKRLGRKIQFAHIPDDVRPEFKSMFDKKAMGELFDAGYAAGLSGEVWSDTPPFFELVEKN